MVNLKHFSILYVSIRPTWTFSYICDCFFLLDHLLLVPHHVLGVQGEGVLGARLQAIHLHHGLQFARMKLYETALICYICPILTM